MTDHVLTFGWQRPPLTANQRMHWRKKADITKTVRTAAKIAARANRIPPLGTCRVQLVWVVNDKRRRDADNVVPTLKAMCDGLVDAGVVVDDTPEYMAKGMPVIRVELGATPHLELRVAPTAVTA